MYILIIYIIHDQLQKLGDVCNWVINSAQFGSKNVQNPDKMCSLNTVKFELSVNVTLEINYTNSKGYMNATCRQKEKHTWEISLMNCNVQNYS